ncbi:MAG: YkgJ family cysteine cluster protein [Planctomycetota bacterium]
MRFVCTACGKCCAGAPGYVWIEPGEIGNMARAKGIRPRVFRRRHVRRVKGRLSLRERKNGDCVMLEGERCSVYDAKPLRCTTFPFWPEEIASPATWRETAGRCEGVGQGALYSREEIERVAAGDPRPLLEKQAKGAGEAADPSPDAALEAALEDLGRLYAELDAELPRYQFTCAASGRCCDFDAFGHRLYATTLEMEHFHRHGPRERPNANPRHCPAWGEDRLCRAREARMLGCRIYFCGPYPVAPPDDLYERCHARIRAIHDRYAIPFRYQDVVAWCAPAACPPPQGPEPK